MSAHTPGPWRPGKDCGAVVADHPTWDGDDPKGREMAEFYGGFLVCESIFRKADMNLIAAAPELLEACRTARILIATTCSPAVDAPARLALERLEASIAKAEGRTE